MKNFIKIDGELNLRKKSKNKKFRTMIILWTVFLVVLIISVLVVMMKSNNEQPWDVSGKRPNEYTWEEFEALTDEQKLLFSQEFKKGKFEEWINKVKPIEITIQEDLPWETGEKKPDEYTWEEYEELTGYQQLEFYKWFKTTEEFDKWLNAVNSEESEVVEEKMPWEMGEKKPNEYTWKEYEELSDEQQMKFFYWFNTMEDFDEWLSSTNPQEAEFTENKEEKMPWETGEKKPNEYTWKEYEELSAEQQMEFFYWFESVEEFDEWLMEQKKN